MKRLSTILATASMFLLVASALAPIFGLVITSAGALINGTFFVASFVLAGYLNSNFYWLYSNHSVTNKLIFSFVAALMTMSATIIVILSIYSVLGTINVIDSYWIILISTLFGSTGFLYFYTK